MWIEGYVSKFDSITKESLNFVEKGLDILALIGFVGSHDGAIIATVIGFQDQDLNPFCTEMFVVYKGLYLPGRMGLLDMLVLPDSL